MSQEKINVGDRITFRAVTRAGAGKATRRVKYVNPINGNVEVAYNGWSDFIVRAAEILEVHPQEAQA